MGQLANPYITLCTQLMNLQGQFIYFHMKKQFIKEQLWAKNKKYYDNTQCKLSIFMV